MNCTVKITFGNSLDIGQVNKKLLVQHIPYFKPFFSKHFSEKVVDDTIDLKSLKCTKIHRITPAMWLFFLNYVISGEVNWQAVTIGDSRFRLNLRSLFRITKVADYLGMVEFLKELGNLFIATKNFNLSGLTAGCIKYSTRFFSHLVHGIGAAPDILIDSAANTLACMPVCEWPQLVAKNMDLDALKRFLNRKWVYYGQEVNVYHTLEAWISGNNCDPATVIDLMSRIAPDSDLLQTIRDRRIAELATEEPVTVSDLKYPKRLFSGVYEIERSTLTCRNTYRDGDGDIIRLKIMPTLRGSAVVHDMFVSECQRYLYIVVTDDGDVLLDRLLIHETHCSQGRYIVKRENVSVYTSYCTMREIETMVIGPFCYIVIDMKTIIVFHLDGPWMLCSTDNVHKKCYKDWFHVMHWVPLSLPHDFRGCLAKSGPNEIKIYSTTNASERCIFFQSIQIVSWDSNLPPSCDRPWEYDREYKHVGYPDIGTSLEFPTLVQLPVEGNPIGTISNIQPRLDGDLWYVTLDCYRLSNEDEKVWLKVPLESEKYMADYSTKLALRAKCRRVTACKWSVREDECNSHILVIYNGDKQHGCLGRCMPTITIELDFDKLTVSIRVLHTTSSKHVYCQAPSII